MQRLLRKQTTHLIGGEEHGNRTTKERFTKVCKECCGRLERRTVKKVYFLIDDIIQYGCLSASMIIHKELNSLLRNRY